MPNDASDSLSIRKVTGKSAPPVKVQQRVSIVDLSADGVGFSGWGFVTGWNAEGQRVVMCGSDGRREEVIAYEPASSANRR